MITLLLAVSAWAELPFRSSYPAAGVDRVAIAVVSGDVTVEAREGADKVEIAVVRDKWIEGCKLDSTQDGREVHVEVTRPPGRFGESCRVVVLATVPPAMAVDLTTASGNLAIGGVSGATSADVGMGDVRLADVSGPLSVTLGTGDVVGSVTGEKLDANLNSGQLRVTGFRGVATVAVGVGKIDLTWAATIAGDSSLSLGGGTLIARYPTGTILHADLDTRVGSVRNELTADSSAPVGLKARVTAGSVRVLGE